MNLEIVNPTCAKCGDALRFNVPRMGEAGGYVHASSGNFECRPECSPIWTADKDENGNTFWEAGSPYIEGFEWRIRPRLVRDSIEWYACHDSELGGAGAAWPTIEEAKAAIGREHAAIILEPSDEGEIEA